MKERVMYDIIWNSAPLLLIGPCGTHVSEIWIKWNDVNSKHAFENIVCKMAAILWSDIQALYIYINDDSLLIHDDVIKWKHFPRNWPFVRGIYRSPVNSPHKGQWRGALMFPLIWVWISNWVNNREAGDLSRYRAHYDVIAMKGPRKQLFYFCENNFSSIHLMCGTNMFFKTMCF